MKKTILSAAAVCVSAAMLCSCASHENTRTTVYSGPVQQPVDDIPLIADTSSADVQSSAETPQTHESDFADETQSAEFAAAETMETEEAAEEEYILEGLDSFYIDEYGAYKLTNAERAFINDSVFVGDSICSGFSVYNTVYSENVYARGSLAAWSFFDYNFYYGDEELDYVTVLELTQPKYAFLSMGMNDLNLYDEEAYCEHYRTIIDTTLQFSDAEIYVCAITPIAADSNFTTNYRIDCFNVTIKDYINDNYPERVHFLDFAKHLKDSDDSLKDCFNGGDGIHLQPYAYYVALWEMNRTLIDDGVK